MSETGPATTTPDDESVDESVKPAEPAGPAASPEPKPASRPWWIRHYTFTGTAGGLLFIWFSMTPSLLPRTALFQEIGRAHV